MTEKPFEVGEVVYLNSGSPAMTIAGFFPPDVLKVSWMDGAEQRITRLHAACFTRKKPRHRFGEGKTAPPVQDETFVPSTYEEVAESMKRHDGEEK